MSNIRRPGSCAPSTYLINAHLVSFAAGHIGIKWRGPSADPAQLQHLVGHDSTSHCLRESWVARFLLGPLLQEMAHTSLAKVGTIAPVTVCVSYGWALSNPPTLLPSASCCSKPAHRRHTAASAHQSVWRLHFMGVGNYIICTKLRP